jgi:hypothetical protein
MPAASTRPTPAPWQLSRPPAARAGSTSLVQGFGLLAALGGLVSFAILLALVEQASGRGAWNS